MIQEKNIALNIILSIVTCGIFGVIWFISITDDVNTLTGDTDAPSGIVSFLLALVTCGIYGLYWAYKMGEKIDTAKQQKGIPSSNSGVLYLILAIFGPTVLINYALMQNEINYLASA